MDVRREIRKIIRSDVKNKYNLKQIQLNLVNVFQEKLDAIEPFYTEKKYIKYCCICWLEETKEILENFYQNVNIIQIICETGKNITNFYDITSPLNKSKYYQLLKEHFTLIGEEKQEKYLLNQYKTECLKLISSEANSMKKKLECLQNLHKFLNSLDKHHVDIINSSLMGCYISFNRFIKILKTFDTTEYGNMLEQLQDMIYICSSPKEILFKNEITKVLYTYFKPISFQIEIDENCCYLKVEGGNIIMSEVKSCIEEKFNTNPDIEEIRFIATGTMHIDDSIEMEIWHGKNIVVYSTIIKVYGHVIWDVSGKNLLCPPATAVSYLDQGRDGANGFAGESGGNILILADQVENSENFYLVSNGKNGANGLNGLNGSNGSNGTGITFRQFYENFPSPVYFKGTACGQILRKIIYNIHNVTNIVKVVWRNGNVLPHTYHVLDSAARDNIYINVITENGNEITFSSYWGLSVFLLYSGNKGTPGSRGGNGGLGGQGGFAGIIQVPDMVFGIYAEDGRKGDDGKQGSHGINGCNGWDIGFVDYFYSGGIRYYGMNEKLKVCLNWYTSKDTHRVYCPYNASNPEGSYAELCDMVAHREDHQNEEIPCIGYMNETTQKKPISRSAIIKKYCNEMCRFNEDLLLSVQGIINFIEEVICESKS